MKKQNKYMHMVVGPPKQSLSGQPCNKFLTRAQVSSSNAQVIQNTQIRQRSVSMNSATPIQLTN